MEKFLNRFSRQKKIRLLRAAKSGCFKEVCALIASGVRPDVRSGMGHTPLMLAVQGDHAKVVRFLLESGANPMAEDEDGVTALEMAERAGYYDLSSLLEIFGMLDE